MARAPAELKMKTAAAGYSGTPLWKKLGLKAGARFLVLNPPAKLDQLLSGAPRDLDRLACLAPFDIALAFVVSERSLTAMLSRLEAKLPPAGMIWIAWPKRASGVVTDLTEDVVRRGALAQGLVDIKVCAIDATWSGLKLVRRLRDRGPARPQ